MKRTVFVWKESIYKNGFRCKCGNQLVINDHIVEGLYLEDTGFRRWLYCNKCSNPVAFLKKMEIPEGESGLMGNITEYERRKIN